MIHESAGKGAPSRLLPATTVHVAHRWAIRVDSLGKLVPSPRYGAVAHMPLSSPTQSECVFSTLGVALMFP